MYQSTRKLHDRVFESKTVPMNDNSYLEKINCRLTSNATNRKLETENWSTENWKKLVVRGMGIDKYFRVCEKSNQIYIK